MMWTDNAKHEFKKAMIQFKGKRFQCTFCEVEGEYDKDFDPCITRIGRSGVVQGNSYAASVESSFMCKDRQACDKRRNEKK